jgi:hypothetical protein
MTKEQKLLFEKDYVKAILDLLVKKNVITAGEMARVEKLHWTCRRRHDIIAVNEKTKTHRSAR